MSSRLWASVALAVICGCSAIGDPGGTPDGLPHGGTGQFRPLSAEEVAITGSLPGRAIVLRNVAVGAAMPAGGFLFYAGAPLLDEPPAPPEDHPQDEVYWPAFEPRRIYRGVEREEGVGGYAADEQILTATQAWEGDEIFDPWAVVADDGTALLYYAGAGGIGVARAPSLDGTYSKVGSSPVLGPEAAAEGSPRRPSVIRGPDGGFWMYYDAGGELRLARSDDGVRFTEAEPLSFAGEDELQDETPEVGMASPGAVRVDTRAGRTLYRLYFESIRADGTRHIYVAGSEDGVELVRHPREVMEVTAARFPSPQLFDDQVTLLYLNFPFIGGNVQTRGITVAVGPAGHRFVEEEPD